MNPPNEEPAADVGGAPHWDARDQEASGRGSPWCEEPSGAVPVRPLLREVRPLRQRRGGGIAAVLLYRNGGHRIVWPDRTEDRGKPLMRSPYTVFEVRLGRNVTGFTLRLPAAEDGASFVARVQARWAVEDPYLVVREQVRDVVGLLRDELLAGLPALSCRFRLAEARHAEEAIREELDSGRLVVGRDLGLRTRILVFVDLDEPVEEEAARAGEPDVREARATLREETGEQERVASAAAALEDLFRRGDVARLARHLARHPGRVGEIRVRLQREKKEGREDLLAVFYRLLDSGVFERYEIDAWTYQVLQHLRGITGTGLDDTVLGGAGGRGFGTGRRAGRPALEGAGPEPAAPYWGEAPEAETEPTSDPGSEASGGSGADPRMDEPACVQAPFGRDDCSGPHPVRDARPSADLDDGSDV
ncbi:hypothetical protein ABZ990_02410 [Streptomyces sp. NPDC046203]|uniref:hypothetical protein n=1 Tax=Streptomyces sp. NPDC046203 TaxID=3154602 RepID=UPI0033FB54BB